MTSERGQKRPLVIVCDDSRRSDCLIASLPSDLLVVSRTSGDFVTAPQQDTFAVVVDAAAQSMSVEATLHALYRAQPAVAILWIGASTTLPATATVVVQG